MSKIMIDKLIMKITVIFGFCIAHITLERFCVLPKSFGNYVYEENYFMSLPRNLKFAALDF